MFSGSLIFAHNSFPDVQDIFSDAVRINTGKWILAIDTSSKDLSSRITITSSQSNLPLATLEMNTVWNISTPSKDTISCKLLLTGQKTNQISATQWDFIQYFRLEPLDAYKQKSDTNILTYGITIILTRKIDLQTNKIHSSLSIQNLLDYPVTIIADAPLPVIVQHQAYGIDSAIIYFSTGNHQTYSFSSLGRKFMSFFEDPMGIVLSDTSSTQIIINDETMNDHRLNLDIHSDKVYINMLPDLLNRVLSTNDSPGKGKIILPHILPGDILKTSFDLQIHDQSKNDNPYMARISWFPEGHNGAFCLQADEIKPDKIAPHISNARYQTLENRFLNTVHNQFPSMKMQAIVVVDDFNPNYIKPVNLDQSPSFVGINDLSRNPEDVEKYQQWLRQGAGFFKLQSHAVHHTPVNLPGGIDYTSCWEFNPTPEHGSGCFANDTGWVEAMIHRLKTEMEDNGLGEQKYFKAAGYQRSFPLAQTLADNGYRIWDFNCITGSGYTEPFHIRMRYVSPNRKSMWIIGSGPALEGYMSKTPDDYWSDMNLQLSRGYPFITSGHLEFLKDDREFSIMTAGWKKMYENYDIWDAWPDEMAAYWDKRSLISLKSCPLTEGIQFTIKNDGDETVQGITICVIFLNTPPERPKFKTDNGFLPKYRIHNNTLYFWTDMPPKSKKTITLCQ